MDRRSFLKRTAAASVLAVLAISIDEHSEGPSAKKDKVEPSETIKGMPTGRIAGVTTGRMVCGGNLFNGYAHGRDSLDTADLRLQRIQLSQTRFLAGWRPDGDLGSRELLLKGAC
jgi:hypothetical protein